MQHLLSIIGGDLGLLGSTALAVDLIKRKSAEQSLAPVKQAQDEIENAIQELDRIVLMRCG
jgi:hypothetical protein